MQIEKNPFSQKPAESIYLDGKNQNVNEDISSLEKSLKQLILKNSFRCNYEKPFILHSGRKSPFYFNLKPTMLDPNGSRIISEILSKKFVLKNGITAVGGIETGAIPIIQGLVTYSALDTPNPLHGFYVKKALKDHGEPLKRIEGILEPQDQILIVDDVITEGDSIKMAIDIVRKSGYGNIALVVSIIEREGKGRKILEESGLKYESIFREDDFVGNTP